MLVGRLCVRSYCVQEISLIESDLMLLSQDMSPKASQFGEFKLKHWTAFLPPDIKKYAQSKKFVQTSTTEQTDPIRGCESTGGRSRPHRSVDLNSSHSQTIATVSISPDSQDNQPPSVQKAVGYGMLFGVAFFLVALELFPT